jgi:hypothetical protein
MRRRLWWDWVKRVRGVEIAQVLRTWKGAGVKGVVWDHAAFHKAKVVGEVGLRRIYQPPYSPELNPAERVLEEVRRWVEGRRYERIEAKKAAVEAVLRRLEAEGKVSSLVGWRYIRQALNVLPSLGALADSKLCLALCMPHRCLALLGLLVSAGLIAQNVGIGTANPQGKLHVYEASTRAWIILDGDGQNADVSPRSYGGGVRPGVSCFSARGTRAAPEAVQTGDILGFIGGRGHGKTQFGPYSDAAVVFRAEDDFTDASHPAAITLETTPANSTTRQERVRITADGRVGIGTSTPEHTLHIVQSFPGTIDPRGIVLDMYSDDFSAPQINQRKARGTPTAPLPVKEDDVLAAFWGRGYDGQGFSGLQAGIRFRTAQDWTPTAHGTYITFYTTPLNAIAAQERMRITAAGHVGIGTSFPSAKLHVYNPVGTDLLRIAQFENARDAANNNGVLISIARGGTNTDAYALDVQTGGASRLYVRSDGQVGIGTTNPQARLDIAGGLMWGDGTVPYPSTPANSQRALVGRGPNSNYRLAVQDGSGRVNHYWNAYWDATDNRHEYVAAGEPAERFLMHEGYFWFQVAPSAPGAGQPITWTHAVTIDNGGRVGLGLTNPSYQLHLSLDNAAKPSTSTWTISSDRRLKTILGPYTKGLPELMRLRPVRYRYLNPKDAVLFAPSVLEKENVGFIAQEVAMIFPEAVDTAANGYLSLNIHAILIAYVNAIQQLKAENDSLRTTITEMQKAIAEMQEKQAAFEKALAELSQNHKTPYTKSATPLIWRGKTSRFRANR